MEAQRLNLPPILMPVERSFPKIPLPSLNLFYPFTLEMLEKLYTYTFIISPTLLSSQWVLWLPKLDPCIYQSTRSCVHIEWMDLNTHRFSTDRLYNAKTVEIPWPVKLMCHSVNKTRSWPRNCSKYSVELTFPL